MVTSILSTRNGFMSIRSGNLVYVPFTFSQHRTYKQAVQNLETEHKRLLTDSELVRLGDIVESV